MTSPARWRGRALVTVVVAGLLSVAGGATYAAAGPGGASPVPPGGPRDAYEASLGQPPRVYQPPGGLGHAWAGLPPYVANASAYSGGEFILDDAPFDDSGADTTPGNGLDQSRAQAAATLPGVCQTAVGTPTDPARNGDGLGDGLARAAGPGCPGGAVRRGAPARRPRGSGRAARRPPPAGQLASRKRVSTRVPKSSADSGTRSSTPWNSAEKSRSPGSRSGEKPKQRIPRVENDFASVPPDRQ